MTPYRHVVQYYETDRMGIVHHSNYIRWMEEARVDFLDREGRFIRMKRDMADFCAAIERLRGEGEEANG